MFYKNKKIKKSNYSIVKILMPSLIGIGFCVISLLGTTFAWFTDNVSIHTQIIESADYSVDIQIKDGNDIVKPDNNGIYTLSKKGEGQGYKVTITATGTASTGFCIIDDNHITEQINEDETFTFTLYPDDDKKGYTFTSIWGKSSEYSEFKGKSKTKNGTSVGSPSEESYTEEVEQNTSQPGEIETIIPSEGESEVEEDNKITESDNSDTTEEPSEESDNSDTREEPSEESDNSDTTEEPPEESETDTSN